MEYANNELKILGLSAKEIAIIKRLKQTNSLKVTNLARLTRIPRTSVEFLLKKLNKRGLVEKVKIRNHYEWQKVDDAILATKFRQLINNLDFYSEVIGKIEDKSIIIEVFRSKAKIIEAATKILKFNPAYRVYYIQCAASAKYQMEKFPKQFVLEFHRKLKKSGIIMEVITAESILPYFNSLSKKELQSHLGRPLITYLVPDQFVDFGADIIIHKNLIIILNYDDESVIYIKNKLFASIFANLFELIQSYSKKYDLNEYMRNLMAAKE